MIKKPKIETLVNVPEVPECTLVNVPEVPKCTLVNVLVNILLKYVNKKKSVIILKQLLIILYLPLQLIISFKLLQMTLRKSAGDGSLNFVLLKR